jgi:hypothetical protein
VLLPDTIFKTLASQIDSNAKLITDQIGGGLFKHTHRPHLSRTTSIQNGKETVPTCVSLSTLLQMWCITLPSRTLRRRFRRLQGYRHSLAIACAKSMPNGGHWTGPSAWYFQGVVPRSCRRGEVTGQRLPMPNGRSLDPLYF